MANQTKIRRIKADTKDNKTTKSAKVVKDKYSANSKKQKSKKNTVKPPKWLSAIGRFFGKIFGPFGRYVKGAWQELKVTKWPNRHTTWGLTAAVIVFAVFFVVLILSVDNLFDWLIKITLNIGVI